ncbi:hypothetical protein [Amycolatopsis sp. FDAARGOS 1241]|uniref:hypothetical protein n=1 Tax=Amycolatopsis sp. FDAARGOS 1241 TaxID=2778070 RepID=UPI00194F5612|nr:hypothetical protein [Amycolatopsis sp. FDAARGOS 1241]QRP48861.1 hypothetical protein I6J71_14220 [Amycolatopsis sp. FDAARGOS 1241]
MSTSPQFPVIDWTAVSARPTSIVFAAVTVIQKPLTSPPVDSVTAHSPVKKRDEVRLNIVHVRLLTSDHASTVPTSFRLTAPRDTNCPDIATPPSFTP